MLDFKKATSQQLYEIATNDSYRLLERYEAVKELVRRREKDKDGPICGN